MPIEIQTKKGPVSYNTVAERITLFREEHEHKYSLETQLIKNEPDVVIMKALVMDGEKVLATGYAKEVPGSSNINKTDALENCETSAVGRCLAFFGYPGTEIASAEEISDQKIQLFEKQLYADWTLHTALVEDHRDSLVAIRDFLAEDKFDAARECWNEVNNDDKEVLWRATTKGGWFTPRERQQMKWWSNDFEKSRSDSKP